jgi:hypothetical protein
MTKLDNLSFEGATSRFLHFFAYALDVLDIVALYSWRQTERLSLVNLTLVRRRDDEKICRSGSILRLMNLLNLS